MLQKVDVAIVGAGWAGLSAANELKENNSDLKILVLEGRHEIGGRCRSITLKDGASVAELGAQWIHEASSNNPIANIAKSSGIELQTCQRHSDVLYRYNGRDYREVTQKEYSEKRKSVLEQFQKYQATEQEARDKDISLQDCVENFLDKKKGLLRKKSTKEDSSWLHYFLDSEVVQEYGASLEDLSLFYWDADDFDDNDDHKDMHLAQQVGGGYQGVLNYFAKPILGDIVLNCKVMTIDWSESGDNMISLHCKSKSTSNDQIIDKVIVARRVLLTVPLGVLKAKTIQFVPELPESKRRIIDKMGYGLLNKCLFLWDENDVNQLPWPLSKEWIERIVMSSESNQKQGLWTEFYNPYSLNKRPMLVGFSAGRVAEEIEKLSDEAVGEQALQALRELFAPRNVPDPTQIVVTRWGGDEFSKGSYSYNAVGISQRYRDRLGDPVNRQLYFAGEACHNRFPSTTQGAFLSGKTAAEQILRDFGES